MSGSGRPSTDLFPTDSNKLMQWRGPYVVESGVGSNDYRVKMGSKTKTYYMNILKKYIDREPEVDVVHASNIRSKVPYHGERLPKIPKGCCLPE